MSAKRETATHCLNELEIRAELLEIKGKKAEAKQGNSPISSLISMANFQFVINERSFKLNINFNRRLQRI